MKFKKEQDEKARFQRAFNFIKKASLPYHAGHCQSIAN
jgi:hypothetical protein